MPITSNSSKKKILVEQISTQKPKMPKSGFKTIIGTLQDQNFNRIEQIFKIHNLNVIENSKLQLQTAY